MRQRKDTEPLQAQTRGMTTKRLLALLFVVIAATVGLARARRAADADASTRLFDVAGVVAAQADGQITVAHEDIPGYMPAMTMPFVLGKGAPARLAPGDRIRFRLRVADDWSRAEDIVVVGREAGWARAAGGISPVAAQRLKRGDVLPAFALITEAGRPFTQADVRGRLTALTFIFTRCPVPEFCPLMMKRFQQLQRDLQADRALRGVRLLSVTLDPAHDTPEVLAEYAKAMGASPERWQFLTGEPAAVEQLTSAFSIHVARTGGFIDHTLATAIVDRDGRLVEVWRGNGWKPAEILERLRQESASGRAVGRGDSQAHD